MEQQNDNCVKHHEICEELTRLYSKKNHDYGDSFHVTYVKWGLPMAAIRLGDKMQRFETLIKAENEVKDESIRDTLIDLANYAIMTVMELDRKQAEDGTVYRVFCDSCGYLGTLLPSEASLRVSDKTVECPACKKRIRVASV